MFGRRSRRGALMGFRVDLTSVADSLRDDCARGPRDFATFEMARDHAAGRLEEIASELTDLVDALRISRGFRDLDPGRHELLVTQVVDPPAEEARRRHRGRWGRHGVWSGR
jgi:hypothetical protein